MRLSPLTAYYLRKLLRQRSDAFQFVAVSGSALQADPLADLDRVIESLYSQEAEIFSTVQMLETLVNSHRSLANQATLYARDLASVENQIFRLLGFQQL
jgi:hypothetical protein